MSILRGAPLEFNPQIKANFSKYFFEKLRENPNHVLLIDGVTNIPYTREWIYQQTLRYVRILDQLGATEGDVISLCSENAIEMVYIFYAALYLGLTVSPLNYLYTRSELQHMLTLTRPRIIFCSPMVEESIVDTVKASDKDFHPMVIVMGEISKFSSSKIKTTAELLKIVDKETHQKEIPIRQVDSEKNIAGIFASSGTTGLPKGVCITQSAFYLNILLVKEIFTTLPESEVKMLHFLPWFHLMGFFNLCYIPFVKIDLFFLARYEPIAFLSAIQRYHISTVILVPPIAVFLAKSPIVKDYDLSSLREIYSGAAPLQGETEAAVKRRLPNIKVIRQGYGMSEGLTLILPPVPPRQQLRQGSVGFLSKGMECKIVDVDTEQLLGRNQPGELRFRGAQIFQGYLNNPEATRNAFDKEGFLCTGDVGYCDNDGYFFIVDRIKDLIKYNGFQVPPAELESLLLTHPKIADSAVIGIPDERNGELPFAFVVLKEGEKLSEQEVVEFVAKEVSPAKRLRGGCRFVSAIPKNPSGKILRRVLRMEMLEEMKLKHKL